MNIINTMCRLSDLTKVQIDRLVEAMPESRAFEFGDDDFIGVTEAKTWGTWEKRFHTPTIVTYTEMMQLLGKTVPLEIEIGDTVRISESSKYYMHQDYDNPRCEGVCIKARGNWDCRVIWSNGETNSYNMGDLTLIKKGKTMQFTKSDLKAGVHFVKDREGTFAAVCRNVFCGEGGFVRLSSFNDELVNVKGNSELDIIEVYETDKDRSMTSYLKGLGLNRIWERTEQTEAQKEMEVLQVKMNESQAKMNELQAQMKVVQAKL
jgi:hypothetical protein